MQNTIYGNVIRPRTHNLLSPKSGWFQTWSGEIVKSSIVELPGVRLASLSWSGNGNVHYAMREWHYCTRTSLWESENDITALEPAWERTKMTLLHQNPQFTISTWDWMGLNLSGWDSIVPLLFTTVQFQWNSMAPYGSYICKWTHWYKIVDLICTGFTRSHVNTRHIHTHFVPVLLISCKQGPK